MKSGGSFSIWFFIGLSMLVNGALIFGTGLYELCVRRKTGLCSMVCTPRFGGVACYSCLEFFIVTGFRHRVNERVTLAARNP